MTTIVFDFDGVLAEAGTWEGHKKIGPIRHKWLGVLRRLHRDGIECKISTCRLNPNLFGREDPDVISGHARECIEAFLEENRIKHCIKELSGWKVYGDLYIDDRQPLFGVMDEYEHPEDIYELLLEELDLRGIPKLGSGVNGQRFVKGPSETAGSP